MIIRKTPKNIDSYELVSNSVISTELHEMGIYPTYMDSNGLYFLKSEELNEAMKKINKATVVRLEA